MKDKVSRIVLDPLRFVRAVFGDDLWAMQRSILRSVTKNSRTAVKACHASGKTMLAALAVVWWLARYEDGTAITTAPTFEQVRDLMWGEIHKALGRSGLGGIETVNQTEMRTGPGCYAIGLSTNKGVRFQGFHGPHVLVVMDEAPGVQGDIWESIEGTRAGGQVHLLALGNPTIASGPFYDAFTANRDGWKTFTIDAFDTPNLKEMSIEKLRAMPRGLPEDAPEFAFRPRPYLVTRRWVYEKFWEWGERSPLWQARVRGQFPEQSEDALISLAWLERARERRVEADSPPPMPAWMSVPEALRGDPSARCAVEQRELNRLRMKAAEERRLYAGIDVAGPGEDETCAVVRDGKGGIVALRGWRTPDPRGDVIAFLEPFKERLGEVNVDVVGIGYGFALHLEDHGFRVAKINVGQPSREPEKFANQKAEFYWGLRMRFEAGEIGGLGDETTIGQLAAIRYRHNARGQIQIESKEEARKRGVKSPDRAEAIMLAFANTTPGIIDYYRRLSEEAKRNGLVGQYDSADVYGELERARRR